MDCYTYVVDSIVKHIVLSFKMVKYIWFCDYIRNWLFLIPYMLYGVSKWYNKYKYMNMVKYMVYDEIYGCICDQLAN
jgi:hypothetical protein